MKKSDLDKLISYFNKDKSYYFSEGDSFMLYNSYMAIKGNINVLSAKNKDRLKAKNVATCPHSISKEFESEQKLPCTWQRPGIAKEYPSGLLASLFKDQSGNFSAINAKLLSLLPQVETMRAYSENGLSPFHFFAYGCEVIICPMRLPCGTIEAIKANLS